MLSHAGARAIAFLMVVLAASFSEAASIRYDLRAVQDGSIGVMVRDNKNVLVSSPSGVVKMQLWAMVPNPNGINDDDQFIQTHLSFLSSGGNLRGDLSATNFPFFTFGTTPYPGRQSDLDSDGDLDIGDNRTEGVILDARPWPWFRAFGNFRPWSAVPDSLTAAESTNGEDFSSFFVGSLEFAFNDLDLTSTLSTAIIPRPRIRTDGLIKSRRIHIFEEDGNRYGLEGDDPSVGIGDAVVVATSLTSAVPEPGTWLLAAVGCLGFIAVRKRARRAGV